MPHNKMSDADVILPWHGPRPPLTPHEKARRITSEVVLWLGFVASLATLIALFVLVADIVSREGVSLKTVDARLHHIEQLLQSEDQRKRDQVRR